MRQLKIKQSFTDRDSDSLVAYLKEIGKNKTPLTVHEEVVLIQEIRQGNKQALEQYIKANLLFVVSVAKQYKTERVSLGDLISEGNIGLIKAIHRFDETRGFRFISYAVWWIRQSILQFLAENGGMIRLPTNKLGDKIRLNRIYAQLQQEYGRDPSPEELAIHLDTSIETILDINTMHHNRYLSLDASMQKDGGEGSFTLADTNISPDTQDIQESLFQNILADDFKKSMHLIINSVFSHNNKEKEVLLRSFGINQDYSETLEDIAISLDISRERTRQIKERAIQTLHNIFKKYGDATNVVEGIRRGDIDIKKISSAYNATGRGKKIQQHKKMININSTNIDDCNNRVRTHVLTTLSYDSTIKDLLQLYAHDLQSIENKLYQIVSDNPLLTIDYAYISSCNFIVDSYLIFLYLLEKYNTTPLNAKQQQYLTIFLNHYGKIHVIKNIYGDSAMTYIHTILTQSFFSITQGLKKQY